jgi:hypothetical protein
VNLKSIGGLLFFFGIGSIVLNLVGFEFKLMMWIDNWGIQTGWVIRGAMALAGGGLWLVGQRQENAAATAATAAAPSGEG